MIGRPCTEYPISIDAAVRSSGTNGTTGVSGVSGNTVQLAGLGVDGWWSVVGLRPVVVVFAFDLPFRHLAFDESRVGSSAAGRVEPNSEHLYDVVPEPVMVVRGKNRAPVRSSGAA